MLGTVGGCIGGLTTYRKTLLKNKVEMVTLHFSVTTVCVRLPVGSLMAEIQLVPFGGAVRDKDRDE